MGSEFQQPISPVPAFRYPHGVVRHRCLCFLRGCRSRCKSSIPVWHRRQRYSSHTARLPKITSNKTGKKKETSFLGVLAYLPSVGIDDVVAEIRPFLWGYLVQIVNCLPWTPGVIVGIGVPGCRFLGPWPADLFGEEGLHRRRRPRGTRRGHRRGGIPRRDRRLARHGQQHPRGRRGERTLYREIHRIVDETAIASARPESELKTPVSGVGPPLSVTRLSISTIFSRARSSRSFPWCLSGW
jgi:hypothetical protein